MPELSCYRSQQKVCHPRGFFLSNFSFSETAQFSLDDEDLTRNVDSQQREVLLGNGLRASTAASSFNSRLNPEATTQRFPSWRDKLPSNKEASRLTDEIELDDADSGSDDLDLLPPFSNSGTSTTTKNAQRKLQKVFKCCSPHFVAPKCTIM